MLEILSSVALAIYVFRKWRADKRRDQFIEALKNDVLAIHDHLYPRGKGPQAVGKLGGLHGANVQGD